MIGVMRHSKCQGQGWVLRFLVGTMQLAASGEGKIEGDEKKGENRTLHVPMDGQNHTLTLTLTEGWVPWDGDVDVAMLKKDWPRFRKAALQELPPVPRTPDPKADPNTDPK